MSKIEVSPTTTAFYAGVVAAEEIQAAVAEMATSVTTTDGMMAQFWLMVGRRSTEYHTQAEVDAFVQGVAVGRPSRRGVWVEFSTDSPAFHRDDETDEDGAVEQFRRQVAGVLTRVAASCDNWLDSGSVFDEDNRVIGRYVIAD